MNLSLPSLGRSRPSLVGNRLLAALTLGIAAAALVPSVEAGVVTINLTDTRNDGTTTTDDTIAGVNAGVTAAGEISISNWLGVGTGDLRISNGGIRGSFQLRGFDLQNGAVMSSGVHVMGAVLTGPALLFPRVGLVTPGKLCVLSKGRQVTLSDCVLGVACESETEVELLRQMVLANWPTFASAYRGTGAPYITLERASRVLSNISTDGRLLLAEASREALT